MAGHGRSVVMLVALALAPGLEGCGGEVGASAQLSASNSEVASRPTMAATFAAPGSVADSKSKSAPTVGAVSCPTPSLPPEDDVVEPSIAWVRTLPNEFGGSRAVATPSGYALQTLQGTDSVQFFEHSGALQAAYNVPLSGFYGPLAAPNGDAYFASEDTCEFLRVSPDGITQRRTMSADGEPCRFPARSVDIREGGDVVAVVEGVASGNSYIAVINASGALLWQVEPLRVDEHFAAAVFGPRGTVAAAFVGAHTDVSGVQFPYFGVAQFAPDGQVMWVVRSDGELHVYAVELGLDAEGNVYLHGGLRGRGAMGGVPFVTTWVEWRSFAVRLNPNGCVSWGRFTPFVPGQLSVAPEGAQWRRAITSCAGGNAVGALDAKGKLTAFLEFAPSPCPETSTIPTTFATLNHFSATSTGLLVSGYHSVAMRAGDVMVEGSAPFVASLQSHPR